jgi:hypothetical protein
LRAGAFGTNNLPEAQAYYDEKRQPLGDQQSAMFKELGNSKNYINEVYAHRTTENQIDAAKKKLLASGGDSSQVGNIILLRQPDNSIKKVDPSFQPTPPQLTGHAELDKKLKSQFNADITKKKNDIIELYQAQKITADEAERQLNELITLKTKSLGGKKPKKARLSFKKLSTPRVRGIKIKFAKLPKLKKPRKLVLKGLTKGSKRTIKIVTA